MTSYKYRTVLLVDDNPQDCKMSEYILKKCCFAENVIIKHAAAAALFHLEEISANSEELPEIILLDLLMPEMDGFLFLEHFSKLDKKIQDHCSIFVLSCSMDHIDYRRAISNPLVINYLTKPLNTEELMHLKVLKS